MCNWTNSHLWKKNMSLSQTRWPCRRSFQIHLKIMNLLYLKIGKNVTKKWGLLFLIFDSIDISYSINLVLNSSILKGTVHRFCMGSSEPSLAQIPIAATVDFIVSRIGPIEPLLLQYTVSCTPDIKSVYSSFTIYD